ncbi:MAG: hypothetical protein OXU29_02105 [Gammaproteobacteria bacterium]|nr:hypothetical protein [Gammaproteobacteria bacterium]
MIPEEKLTPAEKKVLDAFRTGDRVVRVETGAKVRADFLRGLFLGDYDGKADYRGTVIADAEISDVLNMEFCETKFPMRFHGCTFAQQIKLQQLTCPELDFIGCILKRGIDALCAKVAGDVNLTKVNATSQVRLSGADIGGQLGCGDGNFQNEEGSAFFAQNIKVAAGVFLCNKFKAVGAVSLAGADIGGQLVCGGGSFQNKDGDALNAQNVKVATDVFLCNKFNAEGAVSLSGAVIGGQLNCEGGSFQNKNGNALNAQNIKAGADVFLRDEFKAEGGVSLLGAEIQGQLSCTDSSFQTLNARSIKVANEVFIRDFSAIDQVFFANATIGGNLVLNNCKLTHLSLAGANVLGEFQDDAEVYKNDQGGDIDLDIDGFRYQRLNAVQERTKDRLAWVGSMSQGDEFRPQPYEQLMKVYREMGHMNWARRVGFELERKRHKVMGPLRKVRHWFLRLTIGYGYKPFRTLWWFPFAIVVGLLIFSGVLCPQKWTSAYVFMSTLGNGITEQSECERWRMIPSDVEALLSPDWRDGKIAPEGYPKFIPFFYAIEVALPVLALGQTGNWQPKSLFIKWIQGIIIIFGAVALAVPASYRTGILSPRWWDE